ncbi:hypothetical protein D3C72_287740 [compost metagenome]
MAEELATGAVDEAARVVVVFEIRLSALAFGFVGGFHLQARFFEVVVAPCDATGAGFQAQLEAFDHRFFGDHAAALHVRSWLTEFAEHGLVVAEYQQVAFVAVLEVVVDAFLFAQALDEVQVGFVVLHAVVAVRARLAELEVVSVALDAVFFEDQRNDFRRRHLLVDALVGAVMQVLQLRHHRHFVAGQALAGIALGNAVDLAVDARALWIECEKRLLVQQLFEVQIRVFADQFEVEAIRLADAFGAGERQHLQVADVVFDLEAEVGFVSWVEHKVLPVRMSSVTPEVADVAARTKWRPRRHAIVGQ